MPQLGSICFSGRIDFERFDSKVISLLKGKCGYILYVSHLESILFNINFNSLKIISIQCKMNFGKQKTYQNIFQKIYCLDCNDQLKNFRLNKHWLVTKRAI